MGNHGRLCSTQFLLCVSALLDHSAVLSTVSEVIGQLPLVGVKDSYR